MELTLSPTNPIVIGVGIGLICCCCVVCISCIIYKCSNRGPPSSSSHQRSASEEYAIKTMQQNKNLVQTWLKHELNLEQYYTLFIQNGYGSMRAVKSIKDRGELVEIGIVKKGHQTLIISNIKHMQNTEENDRNKAQKKATEQKRNSQKVDVFDERKAFNISVVAEWLENSCHLPQYLSAFLSNGYDSMKFINRIRFQKQLEDIGVSKAGHQVLILDEIQKLQKRRKTIDVHVDEVYIKINKASLRSHNMGYNPPYGNMNQMMNLQQKYENLQQKYENMNNNMYGNSNYKEGEHPDRGTMCNLPRVPDSYGGDTGFNRRKTTTDTDGGVDDIFGTMQSMTVTSMETTMGDIENGVKVEVVNGQYYNVTNKGTDPTSVNSEVGAYGL